MRVTDLFTEEMIDEDIRKWMGGAVLGGAMLASPAGHPSDTVKHQGPPPSDVSVLAQTIWGEARSHGAAGMNAVGHVIKNRADAHKKMFGNGIKGVATKDRQFSCWNNGDPNQKKMAEIKEIAEHIRDQTSPDDRPFEEWYANLKGTGIYTEYEAWKKATQIARNILQGKSDDPTNGALFYHTTAVRPNWAKGVKPIGKVANHLFYRTAAQKPSRT